jgi:hypothetical protein
MKRRFDDAFQAERAIECALNSVRAGMPYGMHPAEPGLQTALVLMREARVATSQLLDASDDGRLAEALPGILERWVRVVYIEEGK